jgi:nucleotide-binding universal stress UspA family protein
MRTILLPFYDDDVSQHAFDLSARLVGETNGYLEGLFVIRRPQILDGDGQMLADTHFTQLMEECRHAADRARARFEVCAAAHGLAIEAVGASEGPAAGWREIEGMEEQVVGTHGRLFDVTVVGREFGRAWLNWRVIAESALFESGRPVLLTSQTPSATFGENVIIAWNSSAESARAIAFSMPLLKRARNVTVLSVKGWGIPDPAAKDLAVYLSRGGVPATARNVDPHGLSAGETILDQCGRTGADLLVKGAYTQSRLRQLMFGGATRHIIAHAHVPVMLAH